ncbi:MAG: hypothetical protein Q9191_004703 [Dirinaria sp. TL-2023a]
MADDEEAFLTYVQVLLATVYFEYILSGGGDVTFGNASFASVASNALGRTSKAHLHTRKTKAMAVFADFWTGGNVGLNCLIFTVTLVGQTWHFFHGFIRFTKDRRQELKVAAIEGPVVRVAPNELSFNTAQSWKDIYESRQGHGAFVKSEFYEGGSFADQCGSIVSERDPAKHGAMKKDLSQAFSMRSLAEQEYLIASMVDQLMDELRKRVSGSLDLGKWFNMMTFDIIGDLAFGEAFGGIASVRMEGALTQGALADCFKRFPSIAKAVMAVMPGTIERIIADTKINEEYSINLIRKRIARKTNRRDFLTRILENGRQDKESDIQIAAHASDFVLAGSETVATALSCAVYYIFRTPQVK